ncbi:MAG: hypothetical protein KatS3mg085_165 [Candidatus Dojkabacteria bacterium]|nr:MAG: hypothetical protein KatS3mg085_165 [Candidatus Dojkabacteria bacterium]
MSKNPNSSLEKMTIPQDSVVAESIYNIFEKVNNFMENAPDIIDKKLPEFISHLFTLVNMKTFNLVEELVNHPQNVSDTLKYELKTKFNSNENLSKIINALTNKILVKVMLRGEASKDSSNYIDKNFDKTPSNLVIDGLIEILMFCVNIHHIICDAYNTNYNNSLPGKIQSILRILEFFGLNYEVKYDNDKRYIKITNSLNNLPFIFDYTLN